MVGKRILVVLFSGELIRIFCGLNKFIMIVRMCLICVLMLLIIFFVNRFFCIVV